MDILIPASLLVFAVGIVRLRRKSGGMRLTVLGGGLAVLALASSELGCGLDCRSPGDGQIKQFDPEAYDGQTGAIAVPPEADTELVVLDTATNGLLRLRAKDGVAKVPVGDYRLHSYEAIAKGKSGRLWRASARFSRRQGEAIRVEAGSTQRLEAGPPFTAEVTVEREGRDAVLLDLQVTDRAGNRFWIGRSGGTPAPRFQAIDESGRVVAQGTFEFG